MKVIGCLNRVLYARETKGDMNEEERGKEREERGEKRARQAEGWRSEGDNILILNKKTRLDPQSFRKHYNFISAIPFTSKQETALEKLKTGKPKETPK